MMDNERQIKKLRILLAETADVLDYIANDVRQDTGDAETPQRHAQKIRGVLASFSDPIVV